MWLNIIKINGRCPYMSSNNAKSKSPKATNKKSA